MILPNFLVIGAARSGTTSLYYYLKQHPQVYMCPIKEPSFFAFEGESLAPTHRPSIVTNIKVYQKLFLDVSNETAIGDVSPAYLHVPKAPERIKHYVPDARLCAILRDPVERAYSAHLGHVADRGYPLASFAQAPERFRQGTLVQDGYIRRGFYHSHLRRYFDRFDRARIRVYLYKDFRDHPLDILRDICQFLGIEREFAPDMSVRYGTTGIPRSKLLRKLLIGWRELSPIRIARRPFVPIALRRVLFGLKNANTAKPLLPPDVRRQWIELYREDIMQLQELLQRDLSAWLEV
jgi:hypothetical protein